HLEAAVHHQAARHGLGPAERPEHDRTSPRSRERGLAAGARDDIFGPLAAERGHPRGGNTVSEKIKVMVVDDDDSQRESMQTSLEDDFEVSTATSAVQALGILQQESGDIPHCLVCDWQMPEMDGVQLYRKITELGIPVGFVIVTGNLELLQKTIKLDAA